MKFCCLLSVMLLSGVSAIAQNNADDSLQTLNTVTVKGFETNRKLLETPASVSYLHQRALQRFSVASLVPAFNTVPGVRMEERSPGSYRLSIRGSLLRSPFGIRNIKVYIDDMPFTDAGGNTYLNLIDPNALGTAEILKGPASSLYGAGTGGAVILNEPRLLYDSAVDKKTDHFQIQVQGGSYGMFGQNLRQQLIKNNHGLQVAQTHLQADGYRANSYMRKDVIHFTDHWRLSKKDQLKFHLLLADLFYSTPGGLTLAQWQSDPRQARPATATLPGASQQKAGVYNQSIFTGLSNTLRLSSRLSNTSSVVFNYTYFKNPFILNYEKRKESSRGLRTKMIYKSSLAQMPLQLIGGAELQTTYAYIDNFGNKNGVADTVQSRDEVNAYQRFYFVQADLQVTGSLFINAGFSHNGFTYHYIRTSNDPATAGIKKNFDPVLSPRFAVLYKPANSVSLRASVSKGFSAPTLAEVRPSEGSFFQGLQPEYGWNYETGIRADLFNHRFQFDLTAYIFNLTNAIVRRSSSNGAEYFINAGGTRQKGIETFAGYYLLKRQRQFFTALRVWTSVTLNDYVFEAYRIDSMDFSDNALTGVPSTVLVTGLDIETAGGIYLNSTYNYTSRLPLTDANSVYAAAAHLVQCRIGYKHAFKKNKMEIFAGVDNLLNQRYSLGNDINAAGNRFYNAAPLRNYFAGMAFEF